MSPPVTTFWRLAGMSYLQYVNTAATAMRGALKEPVKMKAMAQESFSYNSAAWSAGQAGTKTRIEALNAAGTVN